MQRIAVADRPDLLPMYATPPNLAAEVRARKNDIIFQQETIMVSILLNLRSLFLMEITWYGLSCFRLTERGQAAVVVDPYDNKVVGFNPLKFLT